MKNKPRQLSPGLLGSALILFLFGTCPSAWAQETIDVPVAASSDDAEERVAGDVSLTSGDLEMVFNSGGDQAVGLRFNAIDIPQGTTITAAYVQFRVEDESSESTSLTIQGEAVDDAATFVRARRNIAPRSTTVAEVSWSPLPWRVVGAAGLDQRSADISAVIQEIVNRPGWSSGNSLALIITGTGLRSAESFDGNPQGAPLLHAEFGDGPPAPPAVWDQFNWDNNEWQ